LSDAQAQIQGALAIAKGPGAAATFARLPVGAVEDVIGSMQAGSPLHALFASVAMDAPGIAEREIATGLALGQGPQVVADAIAKAINVSTTRAMTIARTSMLNAYRSSTLRSFKESGVVPKWQWSASLSERTCGACLYLNGQRFSVDIQFMPNHVNCRCAAIAVVAGLPPLLTPGSGKDYFDGLSPAQQDQILGKAGGQAYRDGDVALSDFLAVDDDPKWGRSYRQSSLAAAREAASARSQPDAA
jgi:SPP1 gp7 family putative phage head morphogenesis protein